MFPPNSEITTLRIRDGDDIDVLGSPKAKNANYLVVNLAGSGVTEDIVRKWASPQVENKIVSIR